MWDICNIKTTAEVNAILEELQEFYFNSKISIMNVYVNESRTLNSAHNLQYDSKYFSELIFLTQYSTI